MLVLVPPESVLVGVEVASGEEPSGDGGGGSGGGGAPGKFKTLHSPALCTNTPAVILTQYGSLVWVS